MSRARELAAGALAALLPYDERRRVERRFGVSGASWSLAYGFVQLFGGLGLFLSTGIDRMRHGAGAVAGELLRQAPSGLDSAHIGGGGIVGWVGWLLSPLAWLLLFFAGVGTLRIASYLAEREAIAEPAVWAAVRGFRALQRKRARRRDERALGPLRPDRMVRTGEGRVRIVTCRAKTEWIEGRSIEIDGKFYSVAAKQTVRDGERFAIAYELAEMDPGAVIRGVVAYRPPN